MLFSHRTCAAACVFLTAASATNEAIQLNVPDAPAPGSNTLVGSFQGFSMEMADFDKIAGNLSYRSLAFKSVSVRLICRIKVAQQTLVQDAPEPERPDRIRTSDPNRGHYS
jgi:hypothetical protein